MKQVLLSGAVALFAFGTVSAQRIEPVEPDATDALGALQASGYELFHFDLSSLKDKTYAIQIYMNEVDSSGTKEKARFHMGETRRFLKDIPEEDRAHVTPIDPESGLFRLVSGMGLYVIPKNDSTVRVNCTLGKDHGSTMSLKLRPLKTDAEQYMYTSRPFKLDEFESGTDIPLMLYGSFWYDEKFKINRFCGDTEIDPDMSTEILKNIPHYYIVGIRLTETD